MSTRVVTADVLSLLRTKSPALPYAPVGYDRRYQDELNNILRLYFNTLEAFVGQVQVGNPIDYLDFDTAPGNIPHQVGRVNWDAPDATLEVDMEYGVIQQVGQELYARVRNFTGVTIPNGTAVGFSGASPDSVEVSPYIANGTQPTVYILGVMTHDLPDSGERGYCTVFGFVRGLDTTGAPYGETWAQGDILYVSPTVAGGFTNIKPTAPNNVIIMAAVTTVGAIDGVIFVRPTIAQQQYYGTFNRTTDFVPTLANTAYAIAFDSTAFSNGVSISTPASRILVAQSGLYNISCTLQYSSSNSSQKDAYSWLRKNETDVPQSSRITTLNLNGGYRTVLTAENISLAANDYVEIMFATTDTAVRVVALPSTSFAPGSPAANLLVTQVQS